MAQRLVRARAVSVGVIALLLFQATNQLPIAVAGATDGRSANSARLPALAEPAEVGAVPVRQRSGGGSGAGASLGADVQQRPKFAPYRKPGEATELPDLRDAHQNVVANPDGTYTATVSQAKVNYRDNSGLWQPIDLRLVASNDPTYSLKAAANSFALAVSDAHAGSGAVALSVDDLAIKLRLPGYEAATTVAPAPSPGPSTEPSSSPSSSPEGSTSPEPSESPTVTPAPPSPSLAPDASLAPSASDDGSESAAPDASTTPIPAPSETPLPSEVASVPPLPSESTTPPPQAGPDITTLLYPGAPGLPDATVGSTDEGFEFGAVFHDSAAPPVFNVVLDTGGLSASLRPDGQTIDLTELSSGDGQPRATTTVGHISVPGLHDAAGAGATGQDIMVRLVLPGATELPEGVPADLIAGLAPTEVVASYAIAPTYLSDPLRVYPVTLDPTVCVSRNVSGCTNGAFDHFIGSGIADTYPTGWTTFRVGYESRGLGYGTMRGLLYFPDVALVDGAQVIDADLQLHISSEYGGSSGEHIYGWRVTRGWSQTSTWNDMTSPTTGWTSSGQTPDVTLPASGTIHMDTTTIVQKWYDRRYQDWAADIGFVVRMASEGSTHGEVEFDRYNDASDSNKPKLTITYVQPRVQLDFDPQLGATYAPSSMVIGQAAKLPITLTNNGSGFSFNRCLSTSTPDCYQIGYRWFDAKGALLSSNKLDFTADIGSGATSALIGLSVAAPPGTALAQATLRLDLVHRIGGSTGTYLWASDWARPSKFYSRNKKVLTSESTRWVGSSVVERDEFGISLVPGAGSSQGSVQSVGFGDGGSAGINLWSGDLQYTGAGGVGFKDLSDVALSYGYDSANIADCTGILNACGWYTNYDERLTPAATAGDYTYQGPSGNRYYVGRDGDGQLTSSAPIWLERPRVTYVDENGPATGNLAYSTDVAFTGAGSLKFPSNVAASLGVPTFTLNDYPQVSFAARTTGATGVGIDFKVHDVSNPSLPDQWIIYTVGTDFSTCCSKVALGTTYGSPVNSWANVTSRSLLTDARSALGATVYDTLQVIGFQVTGNGAGGSSYVDSVRFEPARTVIVNDSQPAWTAHSQSNTSTDHAIDPVYGTNANSIRITPATIANSPECANCLGAGGDITVYPFISWWWKKVGGNQIAATFDLKDARQGSDGGTGYATGTITYYAGPVAPAGAVNPIRVSDTVPEDWTLVRRNILEDGRQVLNFFDDNDTGGTSSAPSGGPSPDDVRWTGYGFAAVDGNYALFDLLSYGSIGRWGDQHGLAAADDYMATYAGGAERHYFNLDGLLTRIVNRNGDVTTLTWSYDHTKSTLGQKAYTLTKIVAPTDATSGGGATYDREISVTTTVGSPTTVAFAEVLGSTTTHVSSPRQTTFAVATATGTGYGIGDVISVVPARAATSACAGGAPLLCAKYTYTSSTSHLLSRVGDPRWDGTSSGSTSDLTFGVTYDGSNRATAISDNSKGATPAPLLRVLSFDTGNSATYRRVRWQDADQIALQPLPAATHTDLSPDGSIAVDHSPQVCGGSDCGASPPSGTDGTLATLATQTSAFDGLGRVSTSTSYRVNGGTPQVVISRQGSKASAKVDNFDDPLVANELAWTQSPDQYVASLQDSGNADPDLYRTTYAYSALGQTTDTITPIENGKPSYPGVVTGTSNSDPSTPSLVDYWRLGETTGTTATDAMAAHNGTYTSVTLGGTNSGALVNDPDRAPTFNGTTSRMDAAGVAVNQTSFSIEAWVRATTAGQTGRGLAGGWTGTTGALLWTDASGYYTLAQGGGSGPYLHSSAKPRLNAWDHVVATWNGSSQQIYVNGVLVATQTTSTAPGTVSTFEVGAYNNGSTNTFFTGQIDEVALYNAALDAGQVAVHYAAGRSIALQDAETFYDPAGNVIQTDDNTFLADTGFESGITGWQGTATAYTTSTAGDANVHGVGFGSLQVTTTKAFQVAQLVPGQTVRFQLWDKTVSSAHASVLLKYWRLSGTPAWTDLVTGINPSDPSWTSHAWDATIPMDSDGRVQVTLWNDAGTGTAYFDDLALLTTWGLATYTGSVPILPQSACTLQPNQGASATLCVRTDYGTETTPYAVPAIFPKTVTADYVDGTFVSTIPDEDLKTVTVFDAWGRATTVTDPDGVASTTDYSSTNHSDVVDTKDGLQNQTTYAYDAVGQTTSTTLPLGETTTTSYDLRGHPIGVTAPDGVKTVRSYNDQGQATAAIANYQGTGTPSGPSGTDNLTTAYTYDALGQVTQTVADNGTGLIKAKTTQAYDLLGNVTSTTVYADTAYSDARTTTAYFDTVSGSSPLVSRPKPTGSSGPIVPAGGAPTCPGTGSTPCNAVTTLDAGGRSIVATDAYNIATRSYLDLAGRPVQVIAHYVDGAYSSGAKDTDLATTMTYDILGKPTSVAALVTGSTVRTTSTSYDKMERAIEVQQLDTAGAGVSSVKTVYTPGGRTDRVARPAAVLAGENTRTWSKTVYDKAGRAIATLGRYDIANSAQIAFDPLEGALSPRWSAATDGLANAPTSMSMDDAYDATAPRSGTGRLHVTTNTSITDEGVRYDLNTGTGGLLGGTVNLAPPKFVNQHTYTLHADVLVGVGHSIAAVLGTPSTHGSVASVTPGGAWVPIEATWTVPSGPDFTTGVEAAIRLGDPSPATTSFYLDNVWIWDSSAVGFNAAGTDQNIPSLSVFDTDGRPVESILPPHALPTIAAPTQPLVTTTGYDPNGRAISVTLNVTSTYAATVAADAYAGYWPLDERVGTTIDDKASATNLTLAGSAGLAVAGGLDDARTGFDFDGATGTASRSSAVSSLTNNFTIEAWFRADALPSAGTYALIAYNGLESGGWGIGIDSSGALVARYGAVQWLVSTATVKTGTYHHAALVRNAGTATLYLDGTAYTPTNSTSTPLTPGAGFSIGREDAGAGRYFAGVVDDVAVYGTALTSTRITAHASAGRVTTTDTNLTTRTVYDALGRATDGYDPRMVRTHEDYDRLGRVTATTLNYVDGTTSGATNDDDVRSRFAYDAIGELTAYCPAKSVFSADACDPTSTSTGSAAYQSGWHYTFDAAGHVVSQVAPVNNQAGAVALDTKLWAYDAGGRLTTQCDVAPGGTCASPARHTDMTYDGIGRVLTVKTYLGTGTSGNLKLSWTKTYDADSTLTSVAFDGTGSSPSEGTDTTTLVYDAAGRLSQVKDNASAVITSYDAYNPDGTVWKRTDAGQTQAIFTYDYAGRLATSTYPSVFSGTISDAYGPDGLLTKRTWPTNGETGTLTYDGAKRPTQVTYSALTSSISQAYDRDGNVTSEGRSLTGVTTTNGDAGGHTQSFVYDKLNRVASASGLTVASSSYTYDLDSNRTAVTAIGVTTTFVYDRTDELSKQTISAVNTSFVYDGYGNLTKSATSGSTQTTNAYDLGDRLLSITPASGNAATFGFDALGRFKTRAVTGSTTETYSYLGTTETAWRIVGGTTTTCALDASGSRTAESVAGTVGFLVFDLHGNVAGAETAAQTAYAAAIRYDPYGQQADLYTKPSGGIALAWRFQGRLDISPNGDPLYDAGARFYAPYLGMFSQLDSVTGKPTDPRSMNRFLYAEANPWTFSDPSGHATCFSSSDLCDETMAIKHPGTPGGQAAAQKTAQQDKQAAAHPCAGLSGSSLAVCNGQHPVQSTPSGSPTKCTTSSVCNPNAPSTTSETVGSGTTDYGTPPSDNAMWNAYVVCSAGANTMSSMLMCMEGDLGSSYWAVVAFGKNYDGQFDGLPGWAIATEIVAAVEALRVGYLRGVADALVGLQSGQTRIVIGGMEDLGPAAIAPGEATLENQLPNLGNTTANWAQNFRVLLSEMAKGAPIRDASVYPDGTLKYLDSPLRFINRERFVLSSNGWTYDPSTTLWSPP